LTILSLLATLSQSILIQNSVGNKPGDIPTIVFGGMRSKCTDKAYVNLVSVLKSGL